MSRRLVFLLYAVLSLSAAANAADLSSAALGAFKKYEATVQQRFDARLKPGAPFLWIDESPERKAQVRNGQIVVEPAAANGQVSVSGALIHDWQGAIFIPGAKLKDVLTVLHDYAHYTEYYRPGVISSRLVARQDDTDIFNLRLLRTEFVNIVLDTEYKSRNACSDSRCSGVSESVRIQEVRNPGRADEYELPPGRDRGLLWRLNGYTRMEQRDGGVYLEIESVALTRSVPSLLGWFVNPIIRRVSRESLADALRMTRDAIEKQMRERTAAVQTKAQLQ